VAPEHLVEELRAPSRTHVASVPVLDPDDLALSGDVAGRFEVIAEPPI